jgi:16S rRNA (guanine1207-N2)-methyltransferase
MTNGALETLILSYKPLAKPEKVLFLNAQWHAHIEKTNLTAIQAFKPYYDHFARNGINNLHSMFAQNDPVQSFDTALILAAKNLTEFQYDLACALTSLKPGGTVICAADNKAGAGRLKNIMNAAGLDIRAEISKNKARACIAQKPAQVRNDLIQEWLKNGAIHLNEKTGFFSQAGIYGWEKIDRGSALLAAACRAHCMGVGADFGCGYGYLSKKILEGSDKISALTLIDADARAVMCAEKNMEGHHIKPQTNWADLTRREAVQVVRYDFIVMNPPFHEGKILDIGAGLSFIDTAAHALKKNGHLWMVANVHLPYENKLSGLFSRVELVVKKDGFKVFRAVKNTS